MQKRIVLIFTIILTAITSVLGVNAMEKILNF